MKVKRLLIVFLIAAAVYYIYFKQAYRKLPFGDRVSKVGQELVQSGKQALDDGRKTIAERGADALKSGLGVGEKEADPCRLRMVSLAAQLDSRLKSAGDRKSFTSKYLFGNLDPSELTCPVDDEKYKIRLFRTGSGYDFTIGCPKHGHELKGADFRSGAWQAWVRD